jgi:hypothetical protein
MERFIVMGKGSNFEREICKQLSSWWTNNKRDDVFWRTAGSGAMAKIRSKRNKKTFGQCGDIQAIDPIGQPLIDLCSIELKRGYSRTTFADLLDKPESAKQQQYELFMEQAQTDAKNADCMFWLLITKRDRRDALITMPFQLYKNLNKRFKNLAGSSCKLRCKGKTVFILTLWEFLIRVHPNDIRELNL